MVGGRTSIEGDYSILNDVFMFTFLNEQKTEGVWTLIEVEGRWPTSMPTFAQTGSFIYMVSQPIDTTHVLVDNELICQLYDSGEADRQLERVCYAIFSHFSVFYRKQIVNFIVQIR
jgi:hypothetical protein